MLPVPAGDRVDGRPDRFASLAIPRVVAQVTARGSRHRLVAKIAGGSAMFSPDSAMASIGERNVAEVKHQLTLLRIPLLAEDTGGGHARTMELYLDTGLVIVRSYRYGIREL
jgi:chemotaxis protein CheD